MKRTNSFARISVVRCGVSVGSITLFLAMPAAVFAQTSVDGIDSQTDKIQNQSTGGQANISAKAPADTELTEIVVTGTLIRGTAPIGTNVISVDQDKLQTSGATTSNELLASVPQISNLFNNNPASRLGVAANQIQVVRPNLRNLTPETGSSSSTLVLFDGHRIVGVGATQSAVDPDIVPAIAIERVEIVTDGGSSTYGSDAVGGVINFITRKRFDGAKVQSHYGFADNYHQVETSALVGKDWGSGSLFAAYSYQHNDSLYGQDRDFIKQIDWNTGLASNLGCNPGNVQVRSGANTINYALPNLATPAAANVCDASGNQAIIPTSTRHAALIGLHQELSDRLTVDLKGFYGRRTSDRLSPYSLVSTNVSNTNAFYRPVAANPTAAQTVFFNFASILGSSPADAHTEFEEWGANAEFEAKLSDNWSARALLNYSRSSSGYSTGEINSTLLAAAASSPNPQNAINFYDPAATPNLALIRSVASGESAAQANDEQFNARLIADGTLFPLPGGDVKLAVGYEYLKDNFARRLVSNSLAGVIDTLPYSPYSRDVNSAFAELQVPIVGEGNRMGFIYSLTLAGSVRYDRFSDFGSTTNPKFGATLKPMEWLALRANYSTSFQAPGVVDQLNAISPTAIFSPFNSFVRPGDTPVVQGGISIQGALPNLRPQTASIYAIGFDVDPPLLSGLHLSANYFNVVFKDLLSTPTPNNAIFTNFPDVITTNVNGVSVAQLRAFEALAPNGAAVIEPLIASGRGIYTLTDFRLGNNGKLWVKGIDFTAQYRMKTAFGGFDTSISGTYQLSRKAQVSPTSSVQDLLAPPNIQVGRSPLQLQATLGADVGQLHAQATLNYSQGFDLQRTNTLPQDRIDDFKTVDLFFRYDIPGENALLKDMSLTLNVNNVFDTNPPVYKLTGNATNNGYLAAYAFSLGRLVQFGLSKKF